MTMTLKEWEAQQQKYLRGELMEQCCDCGGWIKSNSYQCNYCFIKFYGYIEISKLKK